MLYKLSSIITVLFLSTYIVNAAAPDTTRQLTCEESQILGEQDALKQEAPEWLFYGCMGGLFPIAIANCGYHLPPSIPDSVDVNCYNYGFTKTAQRKNAKSALTGCLVSTLSTIGITVLVLISNLD